ncbi:uncharacterized protein LOC6725131 [Drosophila simulans]|uniref:GD16707 n=1 Tax=Drosophila simulans TaxID=7240 RepID=B4R4Q8_DROSI|nr:uncharacterized protein LOC6725131 [Drosophila simulans]EDX17105.1 GD16707 [Drosophila simulans]KMZ08206.1 uncharacterized protein Dsimw501_GD16707 [Drosophila simulans]
MEDSKPAICPLPDCQTVVEHTHLLRHMISKHLDPRARTLPFQLRLREVSTGQRTLLMLPYRQLILDHDQCLAVLNWSSECLTGSDLTAPQLDLPPCHQGLTNHLPILVMVCRTTWKSLLKQNDEKDVQETRDVSAEWGVVYLFWLLSPFTRRPIYANLALQNGPLQSVFRRNRRRIRNFASRMPIRQFINGLDPYFVSLNEDQLDELCGNGGGNQYSVYLEVIIEGVMP